MPKHDLCVAQSSKSDQTESTTSTTPAPAPATSTSTCNPANTPQNKAQPDSKFVSLDEDVVKEFNEKPAKVIAKLIEDGIIEKTPKSVAQFLFDSRTRLDAAVIGDYLGTGENTDTLNAFVELVDFGSLDFELALRRWLRALNLPGESQKIDRLMQAFAERIHGSVVEQETFGSMEAIYILSYSCVMLNTSLHNPQSLAKLPLQRWVDSNSGLNGSMKDFPKCGNKFIYSNQTRDFLEHLYYQIQDSPFEFFNPAPSPIMQGVLTKKGVKNQNLWCVLHPLQLNIFRTLKVFACYNVL